MKSRSWISRSYVLLILISQSFVLAGQGRMALLMGVGDYPTASGWPSTNAYNDLSLIKETLIQQGLNQDSIYTFLDSACTKKGMETALTTFLSQKIKAGMFIYVHFSGLAQQFANTDSDESEDTHTALVPYDAPVKNAKASYDPSSFMLNADLKTYFRQIQKIIGPKGQLFVSFDASTAPVNLIGKVAARGSDEKMGSANSEVSQSDHSAAFFSIPGSSKDMAPLISFYSSSFNQLNDEFYTDDNESYGLFSYALCKSMLQLNKNASYKNWFEKLKAVMNENSTSQIPVMIGSTVLPVFNGQFAGKKDHFEIRKIYSKDLVLINGGKLDLIEKGTEFLFYDGGTSDTSVLKPIAKAVVEDAKLLESDLRIIESSVNPIPRNSKIFISSYHYKPLVIRVQVDLGGSELENKLLTHFSFSPFIKKDVLKPELLVVKTKNNLLQLKTKQGEILFQQALKEINRAEIPFTLNEKIAEYLRANFLRNLEIDNGGNNSDIQAIIMKEGKEVPVDRTKNKVPVGSKMRLRITNNSDKRQYYNVIDIQPDNQINVLIPFENRADENYLEAGQSYTTDFDMQVSPPIGKDVIKVIMMLTPLDLRPVIATRGVSNILDTKRVKNPFELFMGRTFIEHPVTAGEDLKINISELTSVNGMTIEIVEGN